MKFASAFLVLTVVLFINPQAHGQCPQGPDGSCVTSFSISPGEIAGDQTQVAVASATAHLNPNLNNHWDLELRQTGLNYYCLPPAVTLAPNGGGAGFAGGCGVTGTSVSVWLFGYNGGTSPQTISVIGDAAYSNDPGIPGSLILDPLPAQPTPSQDPDGPCPTCAYGGLPINFTNGDTWITQQDYSIPGLGGGVTLTRTWNSLWPLVQPPEQSGIFGDSWRSNLEERIQSLTGGVVKYWKGDGRVPTLVSSISRRDYD
jgi:hypothetical protein